MKLESNKNNTIVKSDEKHRHMHESNNCVTFDCEEWKKH